VLINAAKTVTKSNDIIARPVRNIFTISVRLIIKSFKKYGKDMFGKDSHYLH